MTGNYVRIDVREAEEAVEYLVALEWILRQDVLDDTLLDQWRESCLVMDPLRYGRENGGPGFVAENVGRLSYSLDQAVSIAPVQR